MASIKFRTDLLAGLFDNRGDVLWRSVDKMDTDDRIVISQGFGLRDGPLPLRLLSYVVGIWRLLQQMPRTTKVELYIAGEGVIRANHYDRDKIVMQAEKMAELLRHYWQILEQQSQIRHQVRVLLDTPIEHGSPLDRFLESLLPKALEVASEHPAIGKFIENRGGTPALRYMVEHVVYMRDPLIGGEQFTGALVPESECFAGSLPPGGNCHLIMVGGPAERIFYAFRSALMEKIGVHERWTSHQFFVKVGDPPTYHWQDGEPYWGEPDLPEPVLDLLTRTARTANADVIDGVLGDLIILLADMGGINKFDILLGKPGRTGVAGRIKSGLALPSELEACLQSGWDRLRRELF